MTDPTGTAPASALKIEQVAITALNADPLNPRQISEEELAALTRSIDTLGFVEPVIARETDGLVVGGRQRLKAQVRTYRS